MRGYMHRENLGVANREPVTTARPLEEPSRWSRLDFGRCPGAMFSVGLSVSLFSFPARAAFEYRLSALGSATYTDNINNASDDVPPDSDLQGKTAGFLFGITPGASLSLVEPRGQLVLAYSRPMFYATDDSVATTSTDALVGSGSYELTNRDNATLSAAVTRSTMTSLLFNGQSPAGVTGLNNAGTEEVVRAQVSESWNRQWTQVLSSQQSTSFGTQLDVEGSDLPNTRVISNALTLRLDHRYGAFTLGATETSSELSGETSAWTHLVTGTVGWIRPLDALTTLTLLGGVSKVLSDSPPQFVGSIALAQARDFTNWSVTIARNQNADLQTGRVFATESGLLAFGASPFQTTPLTFSASGGVSRFAAEATTAYSGQAFASINYNHEYFVSSLSYTFLHQVSEGSASAVIPSITRNAITLTVGGVFPPN